MRGKDSPSPKFPYFKKKSDFCKVIGNQNENVNQKSTLTTNTIPTDTKLEFG